MIHLIKGEFYKVYKSRAFYVCCILAAAFIVFLYGMLIMADKIERGELANGAGGVYVSGDAMQESPLPLMEQITILEILQQMFGNCACFITIIFAAIFVVGEYTNGAVKNAVGKGYARWKIFMAKYIAAAGVSVILLILTVITTVLCGAAIGKGGEISGSFFQDLFLFSGIQLLLGVALNGVIVAVCELCRSLGAGITIGIAIASFSPLITGALDMAIALVLPQSNFKISSYWVMNLITECPVREIGGDFIIRAVLMSIVWIAVTAGAGIYHMKKADVA